VEIHAFLVLKRTVESSASVSLAETLRRPNSGPPYASDRVTTSWLSRSTRTSGIRPRFPDRPCRESLTVTLPWTEGEPTLWGALTRFRLWDVCADRRVVRPSC